MADSFTTNLNLDLPVVGASADTWGGALNGNSNALDALLAGEIFGLTLSAAGSTGTFGVAAGAANGIALASAYTKTTGSWAVGSTNGGLDTGSIANATWYHVYLIQRVDTGIVDVLFSLSATSPTLPTNYTRFRRIGSMLTDASAHWVAFTQRGDEFLWLAQVLDVSNGTSGVTTAILTTLTVPLGIQTISLTSIYIQSTVSNTAVLYASSPDQTDIAAGTNALNGFTTTTNATAVPLQIRTNTSSKIRLRFQNTDTVYFVRTYGWIDSRGRFG